MKRLEKLKRNLSTADQVKLERVLRDYTDYVIESFQTYGAVFYVSGKDNSERYAYSRNPLNLMPPVW